MQMPNSALRFVPAAVVLTVLAMAGCASQSSHDDDTYAQQRCPHNQKLKCTKRSAEPEQCSCISQQDVEELFQRVIGGGIP